MAYFSENYHESTQYSPFSEGDPISMHWERQGAPEKKDVEIQTVPVPETLKSFFDGLQGDSSFDQLGSVGLYPVFLQDSEFLPQGIYSYDSSRGALAPRNASITPLLKAFDTNHLSDDSFGKTSFILLLTARMNRSVWRFKEAAYRIVEQDGGSCLGRIQTLARSQNLQVEILSGFVDKVVCSELSLGNSEYSLMAVTIRKISGEAVESLAPTMTAAYSNRVNTSDTSAQAPARFVRQWQVESISDLSKTVKIARVGKKNLPGDLFPLTPSRYQEDYLLREMTDWRLRYEGASEKKSFAPWIPSLDDFSTILHWMNRNDTSALAAEFLKIWVVNFKTDLLYPGSYRYLPFAQGLFLQNSAVEFDKFYKAHLEGVCLPNTAFAVIFSADLNEVCQTLGERGYRYMNLCAGVCAESLSQVAKVLNRRALREVFFCESELRKVCDIPESESILGEVFVGM